MEDQDVRTEPTGTAPPQGAPAAKAPQIDPQKAERFFQDLKDQQNFGLAVIAGAGAALAGAMAWAAITAATNTQIGWMAVGVGFLVGYAVRAAGKGVEKGFGVLGAVLALLGCVLGNALTIYIFVANDAGAPFLDVVKTLPIEKLLDIMKRNFNPIDVLFYAIAVYEGYRFSF